MTREEAETQARELAASDPAHTFFAREREGRWEVVKVPAPGGGVEPSGTAIKAVPRPEPDDPRSSLAKNVPGYGSF